MNALVSSPTVRGAGGRLDRIVYGGLEYLSPERFVELVDLAQPTGKMLVHLYDPENYACDLLNRQLGLLANKLVHVKVSLTNAHSCVID